MPRSLPVIEFVVNSNSFGTLSIERFYVLSTATEESLLETAD